jgi:TolB protein
MIPLAVCLLFAGVINCEVLRPGTITGKAGKLIPFCIPDFAGSQGRTIAETIRKDLERHGAFVMANISAQDMSTLDAADRQKGDIHYRNWANLGVQILGKGTASGSTQLSVDFSLYTPHNGRRVFGKRYNAPAAAARRVGHQIADDIIMAILKEKGFFSSRLLFVKGDHRSKNIYICNSDGSGQKALTKGNAISTFPDWFPNKQACLFTSFHEGRPIIYKLNFRDGKYQRLLAMPGMNTSGAVSPDGRKLAAIIDKDGNPELYVFNISSGKRIRLTRGRAAESSPSWSPDGSQIAFASDKSGSPQIYIISASGGSPRSITSRSVSRYCTSPAWSPDGRKIAFVAKKGGNFDICLYDFDSRQTYQLTTNASNDEHPSWARNSRHLAFCRATQRIMLLDTETGKESPLVIAPQNCTAPAWEP